MQWTLIRRSLPLSIVCYHFLFYSGFNDWLLPHCHPIRGLPSCSISYIPAVHGVPPPKQHNLQISEPTPPHLTDGRPVSSVGDKRKVKGKRPQELFPRKDENCGRRVSLERNVGCLGNRVSVVGKLGTELLRLLPFSG